MKPKLTLKSIKAALALMKADKSIPPAKLSGFVWNGRYVRWVGGRYWPKDMVEALKEI